MDSINANTAALSLACVPGAIAPERRAGHFALGNELFNRRHRGRIELVDGLAFRFDADDLVKLVRFLDDERKCCPFLRIELGIGPLQAPIELRLTGPHGTRELLDAELGLTRDGCGSDCVSGDAACSC